MALGRNHRIFNIGNSSGSYGISRVYHDSTLSGDGTLSSLLGVIDAGDTEVNEFVYNNSGDIINVDNVVQSNSGEWGNGGESYSALTSNSANWNDISAYQENSGSYQPLGNYIPYTGYSAVLGYVTDSAFTIKDGSFYNSLNRSTIILGNRITSSNYFNFVAGPTKIEFIAPTDSAYVDKDKIHKWDNVSDYTQNNSANWNEVSSKLDASAFDPNEFYPMTGNPSGFLTAHQDISNKLDVSAFSDVSGTFLTAVPAGYATTGEVNSVSSILSAAIESNSGIVYTGIDPIVVNNDDKAISANTWAFSAGDGISFVDDNVNKITRIDVTAAGGNAEVESYVQTNSGAIDETVNAVETNSGTWDRGGFTGEVYGISGVPNNVDVYIDQNTLWISAGPSSTNHLNQGGTMGNTISYYDGSNQMFLNPYKTPFGTTSGIYSPLYYATGAVITYGSSSNSAQYFGGFLKGNEWFISDATIGQALRGEVHRNRGVHLSGATSAGNGFDLSISAVSGKNDTANGYNWKLERGCVSGKGINGEWRYGPEEDNLLRSLSSQIAYLSGVIQQFHPDIID